LMKHTGKSRRELMVELNSMGLTFSPEMRQSLASNTMKLGMEPLQVASELLRIASGIERSKRPDKRLVARDLQGLVASFNKTANMTIFFGVEHPSSMSADDAIKMAKVIVEKYGYRTGEYMIEQIIDGNNTVFFLETDTKFIDDLEVNSYFEATDGAVTVTAEMP
jgi:hypothetical protein